MNQNNMLYQIAVWLVPLIIAIVFHEVAHGLVARRLGDPTAEERGRLSFNPIRHVDPFGTLILPMLLAISHAPVFGWAKPVPVNYARLRNPRRDMVLVALAGPGMNLLLAIAGAAILAGDACAVGGAHGLARPRFIASNALNFVLINIFLGVFNLLPVPPFDGGHVVEGLLPPHLRPCNSARSAAFRCWCWSSCCWCCRRCRPVPTSSAASSRRSSIGIAAASSGFSASPPEPCSTAGSSSTSRSGSARPRR